MATSRKRRSTDEDTLQLKKKVKHLEAAIKKSKAEQRRIEAERKRIEAERKKTEAHLKAELKRAEAELVLFRGQQYCGAGVTHHFSLYSCPSSLTPRDIAPRLVKGKVCANELYLESLLTLYDTNPVPSFNALAKDLDTTISTNVGNYLMSGINVNEATLTAILTSQLQKGFPGVSWLHQVPVPNGIVDICGAVPVGQDLIPRVVIEVSLKNANKFAQLFGYINNLENLWPKQKWLVILGIVLGKEAKKFVVKAFYKCHYGQEYRIAVVNIFEGSIGVDSMSRLLWVINKWMQAEFHLQDDNIPHATWSNVFIAPNKTTVLKVYDYRERSVIDDDLERTHTTSLKYIPKAHCVLRESNLVVLEYPYIQGYHIPCNVSECVKVMKRLKKIHTDGYVHLDIRASNILFGTETSHQAIIDFDFCGKCGEARYPRNFNIDIKDGERHAEVGPGVLGTPEHDYYALYSVFRLFRPEDDKYKKAWEKILKKVKHGKMDDAIKKAKCKSFSLEFSWAV